MSECDRQSKIAFLSTQDLATAEWMDHIAACQACREELQLRSSLQTDREGLVRAAILPSAQQALWRAKLRTARSHRRRVTILMSFIEGTAAGILALLLIGIAWRDVGDAPAEAHLVTVLILGLVTILAFTIVGLVALYMQFGNPAE